ncbi:hypothetical protein [Halorhodospira halochloris]|uniref:hypothetical protein n=1 Tax=Halorhodospira halochloris TaxID=1052 RepID=UPI001EE95669|nr:hypothetical protein [Halorhodospira halochloris]MCG5548463.1 hypothetical protein [Halorhodospira halochloris]
MTGTNDRPKSLARRTVVKASAGPLREVKVELGIVIMILICIWLVTLGVDGPPWLEVVLLFGASCCGAGWIMWRASRRAKQVLATEEEHSE